MQPNSADISTYRIAHWFDIIIMYLYLRALAASRNMAIGPLLEGQQAQICD